MRVLDIWDEVKEVTGSCVEAVNYRAITRAVEALANKGSFDPLICTVNLAASGYLLVLPYDVKAVIRININNNPAFARSRLFEFQQNTDGSNDGEELGWQWHDRGYSPIQKLDALPSVLRYRVSSAADQGKTIRIIGTDQNGHAREEELVGTLSTQTPTVNIFREIRNIIRQPTVAEAYLDASSGPAARYLGFEEEPIYRVVKLSKPIAAVRVRYRRHVFKIKSQEDVIPLYSALAVIQAVDAVRMALKKEYEQSKLAMDAAIALITDEQASRDEGDIVSQAIEIQTATNRNIHANNVLIVGDIYDDAAEIFGPIGRNKIFDRITDAIEALQNKSHWESTLGWCDLYKLNHCSERNTRGGSGHGYFVLPRHIHAVLALNYCGQPAIPRNRWFEFHLNGTGETNRASCGTWDDCGDVVIVNRLPIGDHNINIPGSPTFDSDDLEGFTFDASDSPEFDELEPPVFDQDQAPLPIGVSFVFDEDDTGDRVIDDSGAGVSFDADQEPVATPVIRRTLPTRIFARPDNALDEDKKITIYGIEMLKNGEEREVWRDGKKGWICPCRIGSPIYASDAPKFTRIDYITRDETVGFVYLFTEGMTTLGCWYPDETEPKYRMIRIPRCAETRVRVRYKKFTYKVSSLNDVINLRSRLAVKHMLVAMSKSMDDPDTALKHEIVAFGYLREEQKTTNPIAAGGLQFDPGTCPGFTGNIQ